MARQRPSLYKVDRLSRSLLDFARIVDILDAHQAGLVSVTQQLDSSTSMGRLTLNMLFLFAQFEREMIAEWTSDKMSAARRKGRWTGGMPVLGYDVAEGGGRLIVNQAEAERVRGVFAVYLELGSLSAAVAECRQRGWAMKRWTTQEGKVSGGGPMTKSSLQHLLRNPLFAGKVHSRGELYEGEHPAIVDEATWQAVQDRLRANAVTPDVATRHRHSALLSGLLRCKPCGCAMTHTFTTNGRRTYRYYACVKSQKEGVEAGPTRSVPAGQIEAFLSDQIRAIGRDPEIVTATVAASREQLAAEIARLENDRRLAQHELRQIEDEAGRANGSATRASDLIALRASALDRVRSLTVEIDTLAHQEIDPDDVARALEAFDDIWAALTPREQAELIRHVVDRVDYDGGTGDLAITFRPDAPHALLARLPEE